MAEEGEGAAGKIRARIMPAFAAFDDQLVPGDAAPPGLVRIGDEQGRPARFLRRDGEGVGACQRAVPAEGEGGASRFWPGGGAVVRRILDHAGRRDAIVCGSGIGHDRRAEFRPQILACHQWPDDVVEPEEERLAQREARRHVRSVNGEEIGDLEFVRMRGSELVEAAGIGFEQGAGIGGKVGIAPLRRPACVEEVIDVIDLRPILSRDCAIAAPAHRHHIL